MKNFKLSLLLGLLVTISSAAIAQSSGKKVYNYAYSFSYKTKTFYISNIVNGVEGSNVYIDALENDLHNQWTDKLSTLVTKSYNYTTHTHAWLTDYKDIEENRTKDIGRFKQEGFTITYVKDFHYRKEKMEN